MSVVDKSTASKEKDAALYYQGRKVDPAVNHPRPRWGKTERDRNKRFRVSAIQAEVKAAETKAPAKRKK